MWKFKLPDDFTMSGSPNKFIKLINFVYYCATIPRNDALEYQLTLDHTSLHSPTMCDGNYHQDYYITTLCSTYNTYHKLYPIRSQPQYLEFFFEGRDHDVVKKFYYKPGESGYDNIALEERFVIDLEVGY